MFDIVLYTNESPTNKVDKDISNVLTVNGVLHRGASVIDPVVIVEGPQDGTFPTQINYAQIEEFGRYYYVTNILSVQGAVSGSTGDRQLWELHMHVDVLMSYSDAIKTQVAIVAKQEQTYNLMLDDGSFMTYQNPKIQTKLFSNATPFESQEFVLVVAGN